MTDPLPLAEIGWKVLDRFHFGDSFAISPHGVGIAIGYLSGAAVLIYEARRRGIPEDRASAWVFWALVGTMVGARGFYVLGHYSEFEGIGDMLAVWRGGISLIGGIFGALIFSYPAIRRAGVPWLRAGDTAAIGLPLGIVIGRIGDLVIGDHLGKPTSWALAFVYHGGNLSGYTCSGDVCRIALSGGHTEVVTPAGAQLFQGGRLIAQAAGVHQTALYDFLGTMVLVCVLLWMSRKPRRTGVLWLTFGAWYAGGRIVTDFLRIDKTWLFGLTGSQWASIGVVVASLGTLAWFALHPSPAEPEALLEPTATSGPSTTPPGS